MNREDIIRMAMKAGFSHDPKTDRIVAVDGFTEVGVTSGIERFAALVAAAEREVCAKVCDDIGNPWALDCAFTIRARKDKQ